MNKKEELQAARNMEADCTIAAVGNGRYTREMSEQRSGQRCHPDISCPTCSIPLVPEHAHMKCPKCHYRDSCCF